MVARTAAATADERATPWAEDPAVVAAVVAASVAAIFLPSQRISVPCTFKSPSHEYDFPPTLKVLSARTATPTVTVSHHNQSWRNSAIICPLDSLNVMYDRDTWIVSDLTDYSGGVKTRYVPEATAAKKRTRSVAKAKNFMLKDLEYFCIENVYWKIENCI